MPVSEIGKNALHVLEKRYLAKDSKGNNIEDVDGLFRRVAVAVAAADNMHNENSDIVRTAQSFYSMMTSLRFLPNSPTLMNAGRPLGQLSACFVLPIEDSMEAIFETVKQAALIHKSGGGTGFSFSRLRQNGAPVNTTGGVASGPVSFMRVFNMATEAVKQGGTRRGANMGILRIDHPDIEEFIRCKTNNADITNFNISVGITEKFMQAMEAGADYDLIDPKSGLSVGKKSARKMYEEIVESAWLNGEPGIIFLDRLNRDNVVPSQGEIESTNPCGEQPLLPYESCNLGSINLVKMLKTSTDGQIEIDYALLRRTIHDAVHFLDNVIDVNHYPLEKIAITTRETRKIGLGIMGFADMLLHIGVPYNSNDAVELAENLMAFINIEGHNASKALARHRGAFPLFYSSIYANEAPLRNATITTIAPTGTLSMIAGCSSGVEPVFAYVYIRNVMDGTEMIEVNSVLKTILEKRGLYTEELMRKIAKEGSLANINEIPEDIRAVFVCSHDISPEYHIRMQAAFQHHTDNAVSKTINLSHDASLKDVARCYHLAYKLGCKGVTIYRDGSRNNQVLNIGKVKKDGDEEKAEIIEATNTSLQGQHIVASLQPRPRPPVTMGFTERMKIGCGNLYVTVNYDENGICEVFTSTGKAGGCPSQSEATARLASVALRSGLSVDEVYDQLKGIRCPSTIRQSGMSCTSCPDAIAKVLRKVDTFIKERSSEPRVAPEPESILPSRKSSDLQGDQLQNDAHNDTLAEAPEVPKAPLAKSKEIEHIALEKKSILDVKPQNPIQDAQYRTVKPEEKPKAVFTPLEEISVAKATVAPIDYSAPLHEEPIKETYNKITLEAPIPKAERSERTVTFFDFDKPFEEPINHDDLSSPFIKEDYSQSFTPVPSGTSVFNTGEFATSSVAVPPSNAPIGEAETLPLFSGIDSMFANSSFSQSSLENDRLAPVPLASSIINACPECGGDVEHEGGCVICRNCGFSRCG